jgi:hypothetical protein
MLTEVDNAQELAPLGQDRPARLSQALARARAVPLAV